MALDNLRALCIKLSQGGGTVEQETRLQAFHSWVKWVERRLPGNSRCSRLADVESGPGLSTVWRLGGRATDHVVVLAHHCSQVGFSEPGSGGRAIVRVIFIIWPLLSSLRVLEMRTVLIATAFSCGLLLVRVNILLLQITIESLFLVLVRIYHTTGVLFGHLVLRVQRLRRRLLAGARGRWFLLLEVHLVFILISEANTTFKFAHNGQEGAIIFFTDVFEFRILIDVGFDQIH